MPDLATVLDRSRASYLMVVRARDESHLTSSRLALADIIGRRRGCLHRLWLKRGVHTLSLAGVDMDSGLGNCRAGLANVRRRIDLVRPDVYGEALKGLRAHPTLGIHAEGLIVAKGYDISAACHCDAVRACLPGSVSESDKQWLAH